MLRNDNLNSSYEVNRAQVQSEIDNDIQLDELVRQSMNYDFLERLIDDELENSLEDENFLQQVNASVHFQNGHYCIPLPFRDRTIILPNNVIQGKQRLRSLKNKLIKDDVFKMDYAFFMENCLSKDYAEQVPDDQLARDDGRVWYVPHHGVYHSKNPEKIRIVFYCSASYMDVSLNSHLLQVPDLANKLWGVLLRFREEKVAVIVGDVEAIFHQVTVPQSDRDCLWFYWWPDGDLEKEPVIYRMVAHLFWVTFSPSCCNFALNCTAEENGGQFEPRVAETVTKFVDVDNVFSSAPSEEEAIALINDVSALRGLSIPEDDRAKEIKQWNLYNDLPVERALGVHWFIEMT